MKLNNKGFAITTILYALLILFSLTLISVITGLNSRNKMLEKAIETIELKYNWDCIYKTNDPNNFNAYNIPNITNTSNNRGKYIFSEEGEIKENHEGECMTYLETNEEIKPEEFTYTTTACNENKTNLKLIGICYDNN